MEAYITEESGPARLQLGDYRGRWLALAFFRPAAVPDELEKLHAAERELTAADCTLVGVSYESWFELRETSAAFPIVADTEGILARRFGALVDGEPRAGMVLVDPDGSVRYEDLGEGLAPKRALEALRGFKAAA